MQNSTPTLLDNVSQAGSLKADSTPINLPPKPAKVDKNYAKLYRVAQNLNNNRDMNRTHDFDFWVARDIDLNEYSTFMGIYKKILENRQNFNNFSGHPTVDFTNLGPAELQYYDDFLGKHPEVASFLGINFKKIGHAIGSAAKSVAHAVSSVAVDAAHGVRDVAVDAAHGVRDVAVDVAHGAEAVGKETGNLAVDAAHGVRDGADAIHRAGNFIKNEEVRAHHFVEHELTEAVTAIKPYWKVIASAALVAVLAATGVGLPLAIAIGSATLTGLDAIQPAAPQLPPGFGSGDGGNPATQGGPADDSNNVDDGSYDPDTGQGLTPEQLKQKQEAAQAEQDAIVQAQLAAAKKKKIIIAVAGIITAVIVYWFFIRKKK